MQIRSERKNRMDAVLDKRQPDLVVVLENVEDPHNIGAVMRSADSVGVQDIYLINTKLDTQDLQKKRSAASAEKWLRIHEFDTIEHAVAALKKEGFELWCTHLGKEARSLYEIDLSQRVALIFGNEREGVSEALLQHCKGNFVIPQVGMIKSLNISVACAVSLYEAFRQRNDKGLYEIGCRLDTDTRSQLFDSWTAVYQK